MILKPKKMDLKDEFRSSRGQSQEVCKTTSHKGKHQSSPYINFLSRYEKLEDYIDNFGTRDLVYFFRETSERCGYKYVISNIKKDMAIMKRLKENYTPKEICGMIEFLYMSEQDYLDKHRLSPNLLASQWINTIYADMQLWVDDEYVPNKKQKHKNKEWTSVVDNNSSIGDWE